MPVCNRRSSAHRSGWRRRYTVTAGRRQKKEEKARMKESKRKEIEARLQELFAESQKKEPETDYVIKTPRRTVQVIRRRKGQPDLQLAD